MELTKGHVTYMYMYTCIYMYMDFSLEWVGGTTYFIITDLIEESVIVCEILGVLLVLGKLLELLLLFVVGSDLVQNLDQINRQPTQIHAAGTRYHNNTCTYEYNCTSRK